MGRVGIARQLIDRSAIRRRIFSRSKESSEKLTRETRRLLPMTFPEENSNPKNTIAQLGGIKEISEKATTAMGMLDSVSEALEKDVSEMNMVALEEKEKRFRPYGRILSILRWGSLALAGVGTVASVVISRLTWDINFHIPGIQLGIGSLAAYLLIGIVKEKAEELFKPGIKDIKDVIGYMKAGLEELRQTLPDLKDSLIAFSK
jgi:hypothetical protein